jgi:hypothetical protein
MADRKFTLLEFHLGDGAVRVGSAALGDERTDADDESESESAGGTCPARRIGTLLLGGLALALLVLGIRAIRGDDDELDELEDLAALDADA